MYKARVPSNFNQFESNLYYFDYVLIVYIYSPDKTSKFHRICSSYLIYKNAFNYAIRLLDLKIVQLLIEK